MSNYPPILKTEKYQKEEAFYHVLLMLSRRKFLRGGVLVPLFIMPESSYEELYQSYNTSTDIFKVPLENGTKALIKITLDTIDTFKKNSPISDFANENEAVKIHVARKYNPGNGNMNSFSSKHKVQIFKIRSFASDVLSHKHQPISIQILSPDERRAYYREYELSDMNDERVCPVKKIESSDFLVKYLAIRKETMIRIVRPNPTTGIEVDYREVK